MSTNATLVAISFRSMGSHLSIVHTVVITAALTLAVGHRSGSPRPTGRARRAHARRVPSVVRCRFGPDGSQIPLVVADLVAVAPPVPWAMT